MAGGIDWFRWHHGSVTDPKFALVAKKAGASVAEVIAVWAFVLEQASQSDVRGQVGELDFESIDLALGLEDGKALLIYQQMQTRTLIGVDNTVTSWPKRQPKRERPDDNSTARVQQYRTKQRHETPEDEHATPCNATERQETPRGEERREELSPSLRSGERKRATRKCPVDFEVTAELRLWAVEGAPGVNVDAETEKFRDYTFKNAMTDWPGAWRNWMRRAAEGPTGGKSSGGQHKYGAAAAAIYDGVFV